MTLRQSGSTIFFQICLLGHGHTHTHCELIKEDHILNPPCLSAQVTDYRHAQKFVAEAVNGPPTQEGLPPFSWDRFNRTSHMGLPHMYNFSFITMQPILFSP